MYTCTSEFHVSNRSICTCMPVYECMHMYAHTWKYIRVREGGRSKPQGRRARGMQAAAECGSARCSIQPATGATPKEASAAVGGPCCPRASAAPTTITNHNWIHLICNQIISDIRGYHVSWPTNFLKNAVEETLCIDAFSCKSLSAFSASFPYWLYLTGRQKCQGARPRPLFLCSHHARTLSSVPVWLQ